MRPGTGRVPAPSGKPSCGMGLRRGEPAAGLNGAAPRFVWTLMVAPEPFAAEGGGDQTGKRFEEADALAQVY